MFHISRFLLIDNGTSIPGEKPDMGMGKRKGVCINAKYFTDGRRNLLVLCILHKIGKENGIVRRFDLNFDRKLSTYRILDLWGELIYTRSYPHYPQKNNEK